MLPRLTLSPRQKAGLAVALAIMMWVPTGISEEQVPIVTGHSVFYNGDTFDRCLASIAGILRSRVMWFNDMVLAEQYAGKGTFVYVTENGSLDPTTRKGLWTEGVFYDFVDPNGAHWHVEEAFMINRVGAGALAGDPLGETSELDPEVDDVENRTYVWIVELSERPIYDEFSGNDPQYEHDLYNFLLLVDTCKMNRAKTTPRDITHQGPDLDTQRGHPAGTDVHEHEVHTIDLWVGTRQVLVPWGASTQTPTWQSQWATGYAAGDTTMPCKPDDPLTPEDESGCN